MSSIDLIKQRLEERKNKLQTSLNFIVNSLKTLDAHKIILFGSFAQKIVDFNSDLDLLVIMPPSRSGKDWMKLIYTEIERTISSDIIVFNCQEFDEKLPKSAFLQEIVTSGVILYEKIP